MLISILKTCTSKRIKEIEGKKKKMKKKKSRKGREKKKMRTAGKPFQFSLTCSAVVKYTTLSQILQQ
jgi:hypothetical protein